MVPLGVALYNHMYMCFQFDRPFTARTEQAQSPRPKPVFTINTSHLHLKVLRSLFRTQRRTSAAAPPTIINVMLRVFINQRKCTDTWHTAAGVLPLHEVWPYTWSSSPSAPTSHSPDIFYTRYLHEKKWRLITGIDDFISCFLIQLCEFCDLSHFWN